MIARAFSSAREGVHIWTRSSEVPNYPPNFRMGCRMLCRISVPVAEKSLAEEKD
jgi:hypothetical protein